MQAIKEKSLKPQSEWKIQLKLLIHFEITRNNNTEIMMGSETDEIIEELF